MKEIQSIANSIYLYFRYAWVSILSQMQYRVSFVLLSLANLMASGIEFFMIWSLYGRFGNLEGWSLPEAALIYGMIHIAFAFAEAIPRGFDIFERTIRAGDFDRILLRPRTTVLQLLGQQLQLMRVGRLSQGIAVLCWAVANLNVAWTFEKTLLVAAAIFGGFCLFCGLFVLRAVICFWTIESVEIINVVIYGGVVAGQYPINIYRGLLRKIFLFIIPLATINYLPAHAVFGRGDPLGSTAMIQWLSPLAGVIFLFLTLQIWKAGVRSYTSTGN